MEVPELLIEVIFTEIMRERLIIVAKVYIFLLKKKLAFTRFQGVINQHFETNFKMQSFTTNYKNRHPWMTKVLRTQIKIKNAIHTTCFASLTKDITKFADYNKVKNLLKSSVQSPQK